MIHFTDPSVYVKGVGVVTLFDPCTFQAMYSSTKITTANVTGNVNMGEIRAGLGNGIATILPNDSQLNVEINAADFSLAMKAAQVGAVLGYNAPAPRCQVITASGEALQIDVSDGVPCAMPGASLVKCQVQEVGVAGTIAATGVAYDIGADGTVAGFTATAGKQYKVHYWTKVPAAQMATISSLFNPNVYYCVIQFPVFANENCDAKNEGSRIGWFYVVIPRLKFGGNPSVTGDQTNNDTTTMSGQALTYESDVVTDECDDSVPDMAYYIFVEDEGASRIQGLAVIGGAVSVDTGSTAQIPVKLVMENGQLVNPPSFKTNFTYTPTGAPDGTTVSDSGVISAGSTSGEFDVAIAYNNDGEELPVTVNVAVVSA